VDFPASKPGGTGHYNVLMNKVLFILKANLFKSLQNSDKLDVFLEAYQQIMMLELRWPIIYINKSKV
jgi:hypothetical protein